MDDKPFALFCGSTYYPAPGWQGYVDSFATLDEAVSSDIARKHEESSYDWWQVVDLRIKTIVAGAGEGHTGLMGMFPANPNG